METLKDKFEEVFILLEESLKTGIKWEPEQIDRLLNVFRILIEERETIKEVLKQEIACSKMN